MNIKLWFALVLVVTIGYLGSTFSNVQQPKPKEQKPLISDNLNDNFVISNVRIFDGEHTIEQGGLVVSANKVVYLGQTIPDEYVNLPMLDASGHTLLPGLVDAHTHSWGDAPADAINFGVTTMLDMFTAPSFVQPHLAIRDSQSNGQQADLFSAMYLATAPQGHGTQFGMPVPVFERVDQVPEFVANRVQEGADYIKAVYFSAKSPNQHVPSISLDVLQALAAHSEKQGLKFLVHVDDLVSAKEAIEVGADGLVHVFTDKLADKSIIDLMQANNVFVVPTLTVIARSAHVDDGINIKDSGLITPYLKGHQQQELQQTFPEYGVNHANYEIALANVKIFHDAGIKILAGSDAPNPGTTHGASLHEELQRLVQAGLTPKQVLKAATGIASQVLPLGVRGYLKPNVPATFLLVQGNPLLDIQATQSIAAIWKHGQQVKRYQADTVAQTNNPISKGFSFDFHEVESKLAKTFFVTTDQMMQGNSTGELAFYRQNDADYLEFNGEIKAGFQYPWTGVAIALRQKANQEIDLSQTNKLSLRVRTSQAPENLTIMLIQAGVRQPYMVSVPINEEWQNHVVELSQMPGVDLTKIVNLSVVFMRKRGQYNLQIDAISLN